jgi:hypothetical protein
MPTGIGLLVGFVITLLALTLCDLKDPGQQSTMPTQAEMTAWEKQDKDEVSRCVKSKSRDPICKKVCFIHDYKGDFGVDCDRWDACKHTDTATPTELEECINLYSHGNAEMRNTLRDLYIGH